MAGAGKICIVCGEDCADRPRIKDGRGRYACKACAAAKRGGGAAVDQGGDDGLIPLDEGVGVAGGVASVEQLVRAAESDAEPMGMRSMDGCPKCGTAVMPEQVLCVSCGTDLRSGKKLKTDVRDRDAGEAPPPPGSVRLAFGLALACAGSAAGLGVWFASVSASGESLRVLSFLVGALSGAGVLVAVRGAGSRTTGVIAALASFAAIAGGMSWLPADETDGFLWDVGQGIEYEVLALDESQRLLFSGGWLSLGVLTAFSVGSTSPHDTADDEESAGGAGA